MIPFNSGIIDTQNGDYRIVVWVFDRNQRADPGSPAIGDGPLGGGGMGRKDSAEILGGFGVDLSRRGAVLA